MLKSLVLLSVAAAIFGSGFVIQYSPCDTPVTYSIGTIDERYNITKEELIEDTKVAANIWNTTQNKQLLAYDPKSSFTVNMVYDSRQELTTKINDLNKDLEAQQGDIDPKIEEFKKEQAVFEKKVQDLNSEIQFWNAKGGAPKEDYDKLVARQSELRLEGSALNQTATALGQQTSEYNVNANKLNNTINQYQQVLEYKPEEGLYEQEGGKRKISIYIDVDKGDFLHTLAHEFGHSLGLNHIDSKDSIMYHQTTSILVPSQDEISQLTNICKKRPLYEVATMRIRNLVIYFQDRLQLSNS